MILFSFDAEIVVTPETAERLSADVRAKVRAGRARVALRVAPDAEWTEQALAAWARESRRLCTWLVGQLAAAKPAVRIAIDAPRPLEASFAQAMQPYAALLRRQRVARWTTALVAATVAGVALAACGGEATSGGSAGAAGYTGGGICPVAVGGYGGAGVCAAGGTGGYYGGGICAVYVGGSGGVTVDAAVADADAAGDAYAESAGAGGSGGYYGGGICAVFVGGSGGATADAAAADTDAADDGSTGTGGYPGGIC
jgi:hypothetical protein